MQPSAASTSSVSQRSDCENAVADRCAAGRGVEELDRHVGGRAAADVPLVQPALQRRRVDGGDAVVQQPAAVQLAEDRGDAAGAVDVLHQVVPVRRDLADARHAARDLVDVGHREVQLGLLGGGEQVQHGVGRAAHGDVERHRVLEGLTRRDRARQHRRVVAVVVARAQLDGRAAGRLVELPARGVRRQRRAVARQREAQRLGQAVHRVGGEHAAAGAARRARRLLDAREVVVGDRVGHGVGDRRDQVQPLAHGAVDERRRAALHRAAGDEDRRDVQPQRGVEHPRRDLVAVGDAHHGVGAVRVDHVLDRVGDDVARGQRVEHAVVAHRDAVVDGDRVELARDAARGVDGVGDDPADGREMRVAGDELRVAVGDRDDRLAPDVLALDAGGPQERASARHVASVRDRSRPEVRHASKGTRPRAPSLRILSRACMR